MSGRCRPHIYDSQQKLIGWLILLCSEVKRNGPEAAVDVMRSNHTKEPALLGKLVGVIKA